MQVCVEQNWASVAWLYDPGPSTEGSGAEVEVEVEVVGGAAATDDCVYVTRNALRPFTHRVVVSFG